MILCFLFMLLKIIKELVELSFKGIMHSVLDSLLCSYKQREEALC